MPRWLHLPTNFKNFLRNNEWPHVAIWPLLALFLIGLLWFNTLSHISKGSSDAQAAARRETALTAAQVAQQLRQTVEQVNQITLRLKYQWETQNISVDLEREHAAGLFPASQLVYATIFDANGDTVSTTVNNRRATNIGDLQYYQFHKLNCCAGLLITPPSPSRFMGRSVIRFTRRLNKPDGSFDGVISVAVEPPYLISFLENALPGKFDFVGVRLTTGQRLANRFQSNVDERAIFQTDPVYTEPSGITLEPASTFKDEHPRYVAWKKLQDYPVVAVAGRSVQDAMAPFEAEAEQLLRTIAFQSFFILLVSLVAAYVGYRWIRRRRQVELTQETYRLATDAANEGFYMIRPIYGSAGDLSDFRIEDCNNRAAELVGMSREQLVGKRSSELDGVLRQEILWMMRRALENKYLEEELRVPRDSPIKARWIYRRMVPARGGLALTIRDISEAKEQEQALADLAHNDMLTKLPNRHWLTGFLPTAVSHAAKRAGHLAVLFIDLDNFKNINDTLGHEAGDELLIQAAQRLKSAVRASDHAARLGGDEFVVILELVEVEEDVARVAKAIVSAISKPFELAAGTGNQVNASIGISLFPRDGSDAETLLKHADIAMYAAKAAGKGRFAFYHGHLSDSLILRLDKERALRAAVDNDEFIVHYQPRVGINSGTLTSMEALIRWERPQYGLVYPTEFIDTAEDMGLIVPIGELVIEKVCAQISQWRMQGLPLVPVSVNVSPQQLKSGTLSRFIASCIERYGIEPRLIEAELTESAVIDRSRAVSGELSALRQLGIKLMIDDFGTGYSSMAQLHRLDVDVLKVDQEFTRELAEESEAKTVFRAIMSMADALDICVVAEGVETVEQVNILRHLACNEIQGHFISKAVSAGDMAQLMLRRLLLAPAGEAVRLVPL